MATWPANGETDWNTKMLAYLAVGHATDGTHDEAGMIRQVVNSSVVASSSGATALPFDDTIPQKTEGNEVTTLAITPKSATNILRIDVIMHLSNSAVNHLAACLFQDATAGALAVGVSRSDNANSIVPVCFTHWMVSGTTSATTFKVRVGASSGTTVWNGDSTSRRYGGVLVSGITITEIQV